MKTPFSKSDPKGPWADPDDRNDWQLPGPTGPKTKKRAAAMRKPPFEKRFPITVRKKKQPPPPEIMRKGGPMKDKKKESKKNPPAGDL